LGDIRRRQLLEREPTLVFSWVPGRRFVFGLSTAEVDERFGPDDWREANRIARENYRASDAYRRNVRQISVQPVSVE